MDKWQDGTDNKPMNVKVRLARVYRRSGQEMLAIMNEVKLLTDEDLLDFAGWFNDAGYPSAVVDAPMKQAA